MCFEFSYFIPTIFTPCPENEFISWAHSTPPPSRFIKNFQEGPKGAILKKFFFACENMAKNMNLHGSLRAWLLEKILSNRDLKHCWAQSTPPHQD